MDRLKNKTILIGREPSNGRLLIYVPEIKKYGTIGKPGCVPISVSRCKVQEGIAHAKICVDLNGNLTLTGMKSDSQTYVNGIEIVSKRITEFNSVELGKDHYGINIPMILESARKLISPDTPPTTEMKFDINHLELVWNDFHDKGMEIKKRQKQQGIFASIPMFFTMGGGAIAFILSFIFGEQYKDEIQTISGILVLIGLIMLALSFLNRKNDTSLEDLEKISEDFQERYVCPNPKCNKFLGNMSYRLMKKQYSMHCPYCKCEYVEK